MMYTVIEHLVLDRIRTTLLCKKFERISGQYFEAKKATGALHKWLLRSNEFYPPKASFVQIEDYVGNRQTTQV